MKDSLHIVLYTILSVLSAVLVALGVAGHSIQEGKRKCKSIQVCVTDSARCKFISSKDVIKIIDTYYGGYVNRPIKSLKLGKIESLLGSNEIINEKQAYVTRDGALHIDISQHTPVAALHSNEEIWYLCENGAVFRISEDWCPGLIDINGNTNLSDKNWKAEIASGTQWLKKNCTLSIESLNCLENGDVILKLTDRKEDFIIGRLSDLDYKFRLINTYLEKISVSSKMEYSCVNVKYKGQVVCK